MSTEELIKQSIQNEYRINIPIPNLFDIPYIICLTNLKNQQFYFEYFWNIRNEKAYLSIYRTQDENKIYYLKNKKLINNIVLSKYIKQDDWQGILLFNNISKNYNMGYSLNTISQDFIITYVTNKD